MAESMRGLYLVGLGCQEKTWVMEKKERGGKGRRRQDCHLHYLYSSFPWLGKLGSSFEFSIKLACWAGASCVNACLAELLRRISLCCNETQEAVPPWLLPKPCGTEGLKLEWA